MVGFVKQFLIPGSWWFLTIMATACTTLLFGGVRMRRLGRAGLVVLLAWYWVSSLPATAGVLLSLSAVGLHAHETGGPLDVAAIVIFGNGISTVRVAGGVIGVPLVQTARNVVAAAELFRNSPRALVIASGGGDQSTPGTSEALVMRDALVNHRVPENQILLDTSSSNTHEQAMAVAVLLKTRGLRTCALVTSQSLMGRATATLEAQGIHVTPAPATWYDPATERRGTARWLPSAEARAVSESLSYELLAKCYYRSRGWIVP